MKSMTGYGSSDHVDERFRIVLEMKSYNNRYLDIILYLPHEFGEYESRFRKYLSDRVKRGKVEVYLTVEEIEDQAGIRLDRKAVASYLEALAELRKIAGVQDRIRLSHLLRMEGIFAAGRALDRDLLWPAIELVLKATYAQFDRSRSAEGDATKEDILQQLDSVREQLSRIEQSVPEIERRIHEGLRERFREVVGDVVAGAIDESRILTETAVLLMRFDINEEIVRMRSHLHSFSQIVETEEEAGKKLDFICQELNREINTIGAKNLVREVDDSVISIKYSLEKIREQLRNVE